MSVLHTRRKRRLPGESPGDPRDAGQQDEGGWDFDGVERVPVGVQEGRFVVVVLVLVVHLRRR